MFIDIVYTLKTKMEIIFKQPKPLLHITHAHMQILLWIQHNVLLLKQETEVGLLEGRYQKDEKVQTSAFPLNPSRKVPLHL